MANINLLPWREERREEQRKEFWSIVGGVAVAGLLCVVIAHVVISGRIEHQTDRNQYLQKNIAVLNGQVEEIKNLRKRRAELLDRMKVIQDLQGSRPLIVRVFDEIVNTLPDGVHYNSLSRVGNTVSILGTAESDNRVSSQMRRLDSSDWFKNPNLRGVTANPRAGDQGSDFNLTVVIDTPSADAVDGD